MSRVRRIVHVCKVWYPRITGVTVHVDQLARRMAGEGREVHVVTYDLAGNISGDAPAAEHRSGYVVHSVRPGNRKRFRDAIAALRPDAVHAHGIWEHVFPAFQAARQTGARFFLTAHGTWQFLYDTPGMERPGRRLLYRIYYHSIWRWMVRNAHAMIALNKVEETAHGRLGARRIVRIPNGVCAREFHPKAGGGTALARLRAAHPEMDLPPGDAPFLLFAGSLQRQKGIFTLLEALALLVDPEGPFSASLPSGVGLSGAGPSVLIAGDGPDSDRCRAIVREKGLPVHFAGRVHREFMPALMADAALFVLPSLEEPFATVYLEALASGTPCIGTDSGGTPEIIDHGRTGRLIPPEHPVLLAEAIYAILSDEEFRLRAGEAGRRKVLDRFDWSRLTPRLLALYDHPPSERLS